MPNSKFNNALNKLLDANKDVDKLTPEVAGHYLRTIADTIMPIVQDLRTFQNLVKEHPEIALMFDAQSYEEYDKTCQWLEEVATYLKQKAALASVNYENLMSLYGPPEDFETNSCPVDDDDSSSGSSRPDSDWD